MRDQAVAELLRSDNPLVLIEAAAGCGKTFQGAEYAKGVASSIGDGRLLILTHTHGACGVFAERTKGTNSRVEIRTIDALIAQIATAYHKSLGLPNDLASWAWQDDGKGFEIMAARSAAFLNAQPMVARALARRYPVVICDEHQDSSADQHAVVMALHRGGSKVRIFGDPLQRIYGAKSAREVRLGQERWNAIKAAAGYGVLDYPHRWKDGCPLLGEWVLSARKCLEKGEPIDITGQLPASVRILSGDNRSQSRKGYQLSRSHRRPIDNLIDEADQMMILAAQNDLVTALSAFWGRRIPIWEGHTREALAALGPVNNQTSQM
jgi:DNA helicase-2/ATP-dependent DNA helicase PcrA